MRNSDDRPCWFGWLCRPVENRAAQGELTPEPEHAHSGSRETQHNRRIAQRRFRNCPGTDVLDIHELEADGELGRKCQRKSSAAELTCQPTDSSPGIELRQSASIPSRSPARLTRTIARVNRGSHHWFAQPQSQVLLRELHEPMTVASQSTS